MKCRDCDKPALIETIAGEFFCYDHYKAVQEAIKAAKPDNLNK